MKDQELNAKIRQAFANAAPDLPDGLLSQCEEQKGTVIYMNEQKKKNPWARRFAAAAAAVVLIVGAAFGTASWQGQRAVASTVLLDVNPSIEIQVNRQEKVLSVTPRNEDAQTVVGDMDFKGSSLDVTINALIGSMVRNGYLNELANSILVSVDDADPDHAAQLQARLAEEIASLLQTDAFSGSVLSQTVTADDELQQLADRYGITLGKAQLIRQIITQDTRYSFADLVSLSINELNLISESGSLKLEQVTATGTASSQAYIGIDAAKAAALAHAGLSGSDISGFDCEMDYKHGVMVYELEFLAGGYEYEYDIDALTGSVVKYEQEPNGHTVSGSAASSGSCVGEDAAVSAVLSHAGVSADSVTSLHCKLDHDDGLDIYEVDFYANGYKYEYEINALTGAVIKFEREAKNPPASTSASGSASYIGAEEAKSAALAHAGLSVSEVTSLHCELDHDKNAAVYKVEFRAGGYEYEYRIDALTGAVLKYEQERDD
ncbi:MAG: PepSY domain-containing protein [Oscillospiraceae bacterium]